MAAMVFEGSQWLKGRRRKRIQNTEVLRDVEGNQGRQGLSTESNVLKGKKIVFLFCLYGVLFFEKRKKRIKDNI